MWEVASQQSPWEGCNDLQMMFATVSGQFKQYHPFPPETNQDIIKLCHSSWELAPQDRPSAERILVALERMRASGSL